MEENLSLKQMEEIAKTYSEEELIFEGKRLIDEDYSQAITIFEELCKREGKRNLAKLYLSVLYPAVYGEVKEWSKSPFGKMMEIQRDEERES